MGFPVQNRQDRLLPAARYLFAAFHGPEKAGFAALDPPRLLPLSPQPACWTKQHNRCPADVSLSSLSEHSCFQGEISLLEGDVYVALLGGFVNKQHVLVAARSVAGSPPVVS